MSKKRLDSADDGRAARRKSNVVLFRRRVHEEAGRRPDRSGQALACDRR